MNTAWRMVVVSVWAAAAVAAAGWALSAEAQVRPLQARDGRAVVVMQEMAFNPGVVRIRAGDSVTWINRDDRDHSIVAADGSFASGNLGAGQSYARTFPQKGTYSYSCAYHPRMRGQVVVE